MSERITSEQVQSDVESYALRASPDGRRRVIREALDKARREGGEDAQAEVARLRKLFDDAGQGEHDVLALVDHYQADAMRMSAEVARLREALEIACDWWGGCEHHPDDCPGVADECKAAKRVNELAAKGAGR